MAIPVQHTVHLTLTGEGNSSYSGTLVLQNLTLTGADDDVSGKGLTGNSSIDDPAGASYYVIAVILVYSMSIVIFLLSNINSKHAKQVQQR